MLLLLQQNISNPIISIGVWVIVFIAGFIAVRIHKLLDWKDAAAVDIALLKNTTDSIKKAVKDELPTIIKDLSEDVSKTHSEMTKVFAEEINPIREDVSKLKLDVRDLQYHTKIPKK